MCFPLAPVSLPLSHYDGTIRKTVKSKIFDAAMHDLTAIKQEDLPSAEKLSTCFLDLAAEIRLHLKKCENIRQLAWEILMTIPNQYKTVYIFVIHIRLTV